MESNKIPVCSQCGSDNIRQNADCEYDPETKKWEPVSLFDHMTCEDCEGECSVLWVGPEDPKPHRIELLEVVVRRKTKIVYGATPGNLVEKATALKDEAANDKQYFDAARVTSREVTYNIKQPHQDI